MTELRRHRRAVPCAARRGAGLAGVLAIMTIAALAAFTMAAVTMSHATRAHRMVNAQHALFLAEGALAQAISRVKSDGAFGTRGETITYGSGTDQAWVTFDRANRIVPTVGSRAGILYSANNLSGSNGTGSGGVSVASGTMHIVATGASGGQTRVVEALVGVPRYPYVVSAMGAVNAPGSLVLKAAASASSYLADPNGSTAVLPSNLGAQGGVSVQGDCTITGDVVARDVKTIQLPLKVTVGGVVRSGNIRLPDIPLQQYDPLAMLTSLSILKDTAIGQSGQTLTLTDSRHYTPTSRTLTVQGSLALSNAILYVDGNLVIKGALSGRGIVIVTGDAIIEGAIDIATAKADQLTAVLVGGNVTLSGAGGTNYFQGLVYSRGRFTASNLTIAGIFMSGGGLMSTGGAPTPGGSMTLDNVTAVYLPEAADLVISISEPVGSVGIGAYTSSIEGSSAKSMEYFYSHSTPTENTIHISTGMFTGYDETRYTYQSPPTERKDIAYLPASDPLAQRIVAAGQRKLQELNSKFSMGGNVTGDLGSGFSFGALSITDGKTVVRCDFNQVRLQYRLSDGRVVPSASDTDSVPPAPGASAIAVLRSAITTADLENFATGFTMTDMFSPSGSFGTNGRYQLYCNPTENLSRVTSQLAQMGTSTKEMLDTSYQVQKAMVDELNRLTGDQGNKSSATHGEAVSLDLNQFFGTERPLRIIAWQEHE